jgi:heptosyltransferase III
MRRLLIRPGAIGDCILSIPALEHLQAGYTEIWCPRAVVPLIQFGQCVRPLSSTGLDLAGVTEAPASLWERLASFDSIVSWYGSNRAEFAQEVARRRLPFEFLRALPPIDFTGHATDFYSSQVGAAAGLRSIIRLAQPESRDTIVIQPFSGSARKNWPLSFFFELASLLPLPVEWTAGPEEKLEGATRFDDLGELGSWMSGARLYIGNDSGITHLAAAVGMSTLALFGPHSTRTWVPRGPNVTVLQTDNLERLRPEEVAGEALRTLMEESPAVRQ